jgi:hypothetical protein
LDTRKPGGVSQEYDQELYFSLVIAYIDKYNDDGVYTNENANAPEHYFVHIRWWEHSMIEC